MSANYKDFEPVAVSPYRFMDDAQQDTILHEVVEQRTPTSADGQQFSAIHANRAFGENGSIIRIVSVFGNTGASDQQYIGSQYAAAFPDREHIALDLPGHGNSDSLTKAQRNSIKKTGDLSLVAGAQVEAALSLNPSLKDVILVGEGVGQLMAAEFTLEALKRGVAVRHVFGFDPMLEERSPIGLASSYLANAQKSRGQRKSDAERPGEQKLEDAFSVTFAKRIANLSPVTEVTRPQHAGVMARERAVLAFMFSKSPFTQGRGLNTVQELLEADPNVKANLLFAGRSVVGRLTNQIAYNLEDLRMSNGNRLQYDVWPSDNQDIGLARHQPRLVKYVKRHA